MRAGWRGLMNTLHADHARLMEVSGLVHGMPPRSMHLHPSFIAVALFRISHQLLPRHRLLARFVWHLNTFVTGADLSPSAEIGEGFVVVNPAGIAVSGKAGRNLTLMPCSGLGGELGRREDVGAGPGLPVLGDDVVIEPHAGVLGPVRVGHRVRVGGGLPLTKDAPDDVCVEGPTLKMLRKLDVVSIRGHR